MKTKKKVFTENGTLFSPKSSRHLRSDAQQSQSIGGDADVDHTQTIGGIQSNFFLDIYPPSPRVSAPLGKIIYKNCVFTNRLSVFRFHRFFYHRLFGSFRFITHQVGIKI